MYHHHHYNNNNKHRNDPTTKLYKTLTIIGSVIIFIFIWIHTTTTTTNNNAAESAITATAGAQNEHKIAIIIPYIASEDRLLPHYFHLFAESASGSIGFVDFYVICANVSEYHLLMMKHRPLPANVHLLNVSVDELAQLFVDGLLSPRSDRRDDDDYNQILVKESSSDGLYIFDNNNVPVINEDSFVYQTTLRNMELHLRSCGYCLVEFKPATGAIFHELLYEGGYTHWGYSDLDIIFGDLQAWITPEELDNFDIVTYGFGDQHRIYLRGQLSIHKNIPKVNEVWRECKHLSRIHKRFEDRESFRLESAEGCYSGVALQREDLKIKYAVKGLTDVNEPGNSVTHGDKSDIVYMIKKQSKEGYFILKSEDSIDHFKKYDEPSQNEEGIFEKVETYKHSEDPVECMYWAPRVYQRDLCAKNVSLHETVYLVNGTLYKRSYKNYHESNTFPFFHFQDWKRTYRPSQLSQEVAPERVRGWQISRAGVVPIFFNRKEIQNQSSVLNANKNITLPTDVFCLESTEREARYPSPHVYVCKSTISWQDEEKVDILSHAKNWGMMDDFNVTLTLTLEINSQNLSQLDKILVYTEKALQEWSPFPSVLVVHMANTPPDKVHMIRQRLGYKFPEALIGIIVSKDDSFVSRKALINMARAAAPTRFFITGLEIERGFLLSKGAKDYIKRTTISYSDEQGFAFIIPHFIYKGDITPNSPNNLKRSSVIESVSLKTLLKMSQTNQLGVPRCSECSIKSGKSAASKDETILNQLKTLWWKLTNLELSGNGGVVLTDELQEEHLTLRQLLINLWKKENYEVYRYFHFHPVILSDKFGKYGWSTHREVEELPSRCFDLLYLIKLASLDYNISVLPGAFVVGDSSQELYCLNRNDCKGCSMQSTDNLLNRAISEEMTITSQRQTLWDLFGQ